jgi:type II secretory pathway component PulM
MKVTPRERKFLLAALVAAVAFVLLEFVIAPPGASEIDTGIDQLALEQRTLRRQEELAAAARLPSAVAALQARLAQERKGLLPGSDPNQAGAQLGTWLARLAANQQLEVLRTDFLPTASVAPGLVRVPVRIELHGRITPIVAFLTSVTQGDQMASVDQTQLSNYGDDKNKELLCVVVVSGLMSKPGSGRGELPAGQGGK